MRKNYLAFFLPFTDFYLFFYVFQPKLMLAGSSTRSVSCKRLRPVKDSCQIANKIFRHGSTETSRGCPSDEIVTPDYCKISVGIICS